jgi:hypothetical protein
MFCTLEQFQAGARDCSLHRCVQTGSEAQRASPTGIPGILFPGIKPSRHVASPSHLLLVPKSTKHWKYTATFAYVVPGVVLNEMELGVDYLSSYSFSYSTSPHAVPQTVSLCG